MVEKLTTIQSKNIEKLSVLNESLRQEYPILGQDPSFLVRYVSLTDDLIGKIDQIRKESTADNSTIIWLDKSARPVCWFYRVFYDYLLPKENPDQRLKQPHHSFLNIDRETWQNILGLSTEDGGLTWNRLPPRILTDIKDVFSFYPQIQNSDSNIFVVDEVKNSGTTLDIAVGMIKRAFPEANVHGLYWMNKGYILDKQSGQFMNAEVPVWYSDRKTTGRLVANIDSSKSAKSSNINQRRGRFILSTRFNNGIDKEGVQLKKDINQLADDLKNHQLPFVPGVLDDKYGLETIEERITRLNGLPFENFVKIRQQSQGDYLKFIYLIRQYHQSLNLAKLVV